MRVLTIDPVLRESLGNQPRELVNLIVRVSGDLEQRAVLLSQRGVQIRHQLRLTKALAVRCSGEAALKLLSLPWVERIEEDRPVRAMGG
jgi:hypothetical protein